MRDHERELPKPAAHALPAPPARAVAAPVAAQPTPTQRLAALDTASVMRLQRTAGNRGVVQMLAGDEERSPVHDVVGSGGGQPLDAGTRGTMEAAFGRSFEDVRVHTDGQAARSAESVGANAYTVGSEMVFKGGHYDPASAAGQRTIAHELSHVVQQSQGPVDGTDAPGGIKVSDPSDRFEQAADHRAEQVMASMGDAPTSSARAAAGAAGIQRDEDPSAPMPRLQRETQPEEEEAPAG